MKFLAIEHELQTADWDHAGPVLQDEARSVFALYKKGIIREIYFNEEHNAVLILEGNSKKEITKILDEMPLVKNGFICFSITALSPYTGFERLFNSTS